MAEVTSEAVIYFDVNGNQSTEPNNKAKANDDLVKALREQNRLTDQANKLANQELSSSKKAYSESVLLEQAKRLERAQQTGIYVNPQTGASTTNKHIIDFLQAQNAKMSTGVGLKNREEFFKRNQEPFPEADKFAENIDKVNRNLTKMAVIITATAVGFAAPFDIIKSTIGSGSYEFENRRARGEASALSTVGIAAGGIIGGLLGSVPGALIGAQVGGGIGDILGLSGIAEAEGNTRLRQLSNLTGGMFIDYSGLKSRLGSEQGAQDFLNITKSVMSSSSGMMGLTGDAGIEFSKTFSNLLKHTLDPSEQAGTASTIAALFSHSGFGADTRQTAKGITQLVDMAKQSGVMPNVLASAALNFQSQTGSRDFGEALKFAQLQVSQGSTVAGIAQNTMMSEAQQAVKEDVILKMLGLSRDDLIFGDSAKISDAIGSPTTGINDYNIKQAMFNQVSPYLPFYNSSHSGSGPMAQPESMQNVNTMHVNATTIYLSGNMSNMAENSPMTNMPKSHRGPVTEPIASFSHGKRPSFKQMFEYGAHDIPREDGESGLYGNMSDMAELGRRLGRKVDVKVTH